MVKLCACARVCVEACVPTHVLGDKRVVGSRLPEVSGAILGKKKLALCSPRGRQESRNGEKLERISELGYTFSPAELLEGHGLLLDKMNYPHPEMCKHSLDVHCEGSQIKMAMLASWQAGPGDL